MIVDIMLIITNVRHVMTTVKREDLLFAILQLVRANMDAFQDSLEKNVTRHVT